MRTKAIFAAVVLALAPLPISAQNYLAGEAAYKRGDFATALREWKLLAEQGHADAQNSLGIMYSIGIGVLQDDAESMRWHHAAAKQGHAFSQDSLSFSYMTKALNFLIEHGLDVPNPDLITSVMWRNIAAVNGVGYGSDWGDLSTADRSEAQRRMGVCMTSNYQDCE